jgi:hypothetical protein
VTFMMQATILVRTIVKKLKVQLNKLMCLLIHEASGTLGMKVRTTKFDIEMSRLPK